MKKILTLLTLSLSCFCATAQIQVGSAEIPQGGKAGKLSHKDFAAFRQTTTLFTLQAKDYAHEEDFENAIRKVWTVTPFKIIPVDKLGQYIGDKRYSFASFSGYIYKEVAHLTYDIWMAQTKKNGRFKKQKLFARIALYSATDDFSVESHALGNKKAQKSLADHLYNGAHFHNWQPGFLVGYLKGINDLLQHDERHGLFDEARNKQALQALREKTLYVPDYVKLRSSTLLHPIKEDEEKDDDETDPKNNYPFPLQYIGAGDLSMKILDSSTPIYYLAFVKCGNDKFVGIYTSDGQQLYSSHNLSAYLFKRRDFRKIRNAIE